MQLTVSQAEALRSLMLQRDAAIFKMGLVFGEAGLDPAVNYQINWDTREVTMPVMADLPVAELVPINRAGRRRKE